MLSNFNETIKANSTPEGKISTLKKIIQIIERVNTNPQNEGKCITCKHYVYIDSNAKTSSLDPFANLYCDIKPKSYRVCDCHSCDDYVQKDYKSQINEIKNKINLLKGEII